jgi:hypothetical protein
MTCPSAIIRGDDSATRQLAGSPYYSGMLAKVARSGSRAGPGPDTVLEGLAAAMVEHECSEAVINSAYPSMPLTLISASIPPANRWAGALRLGAASSVGARAIPPSASTETERSPRRRGGRAASESADDLAVVKAHNAHRLVSVDYAANGDPVTSR